jgi:hypothetical protein
MKNFKDIHEATLTNAAMTFLLLRFALLIKNTYSKWDAFKLGLIDKNGEILKRASTTQEKNAFGKLEQFVLKIKKVLLKYIKSEKLLTILVYAYILKMESPNIAILELEEHLSTVERNDLIKLITLYYEGNKTKF